MCTGDDGLASVGLDDTKVLTLDANTKVELSQQGNALKLKRLDASLSVRPMTHLPWRV